MTKRLKIMIKDEGIRIIVKPEIVLEVAFDSIQKSNIHDSGFALRFPRIKNIREDKKVSYRFTPKNQTNLRKADLYKE